MTAVLREKGVAYFSVPKCACSSLKDFFFEIENGFPFRAFRRSGRPFHVHHAYPSRKLTQEHRKSATGLFRIAVVRDPVSRILSCYRNRVVHYRELSRERLKGLKRFALLRPDPDLSTFVTNLERYRMVSGPIRGHSGRLSFYLGTDPSWFDRIYDISELDQLVADVGARVGEVPELKHRQTGGPSVSSITVTEQDVARIRKLYDEDYKIFGSFFKRKEDAVLQYA